MRRLATAAALALAACGPSVSPAEIAPRRALGAALLNGRVVVVGGWSGTTTQLDTVEILSGDRWIAGPPLTVARSQHGLVSAAGRLWVLGGWSATEGLVSEVEALGPSDTAWRTVTHLPTPRREPGVVVWEQRIVVAGGFDGQSDADLDGYRDTVEAYDPASGIWTTLARLNEPRRGLALVATRAGLYAIGGFTADNAYSATVERYDSAAERWQIVAWPIAPRTWAAHAVVDDDVLIIGGYNSDGFLDLIERVDPQHGTVCRPPPLDRARAWLAAVPVDDRVLTLGGEEPTGIGGATEWIETTCQP